MEPREIALQRYTVIAPLLKPELEGAEKRRIRNQILSQGEISERTLRRYLARYKKEGFVGLLPKERSDKDTSKAIADDILKEAAELKEELPQRSIKRIIQILEGEKIIPKGSISRSTLSRHLFKMGYGTREVKEKKQKGYASRRFQKEHRNVLWQGDIKYGPYIPDPNKPGKRMRTYLVCFLDDATRLICHAEFYANQRLPVLEDCFRKSLLKCGVPDGIYIDNGKIYVSKWFRMACARLNIRHINTKPYSPESKGKQERANRSVDEFIQEVELQKSKTLEELNKHFRVWLDEGYNHREHSSLKGKSPAVAFASDSRKIRFVTPEECRDCFLWEETRMVDKTGCVKLKGLVYEVGMEYIRKKVDLRYDPFQLDEVEVWSGGEKKKIVSPLTIGEYTSKLVQENPKSQKTTNSRLLKVLEEENKKRTRKSLGAISFRSLKGSEENV